MTISPTFRLLTSNDAGAFQALRLQALQTNPAAFLSDFESEAQRPTQRFAQELVFAALQPPFGYYGCFVHGEAGEVLAGYVQVTSTGLSKQKHLAYLYNLYFDPTYRGQGWAASLIHHILEILKQHQIERLYASYVASNQPAQQFYEKLGFREYGRRPGSIKWQDGYDDEVEVFRPV